MTSDAQSLDILSPVTLEAIPLSELNEPGNLLQSGFWGTFKAAAGWTPRGFSWKTANPAGSTPPGSFQGRFLLLERRFPLGLRMAYIPYGPLLPDEINTDSAASTALLTDIVRALKPRLPRGCFVIRFDLTGGTRGSVGSSESSLRPQPLNPPLRPAPYRVQPPDTVILNIEPDENTLLAGMHKKTRYNIRLAERKAVIIHRYRGDEALKNLGAWYRLYEETGSRDGISLHPESYYRRLFELAGGKGNTASGSAAGAASDGEPGTPHGSPELSLYTAEHEGDTLAGIIVARSGGRAVYMYGASGALKRELMPNQLLQWTAIKDARREGALEYDFFGIPPADDPSHPMHGLWRFKTGFGGDIIHYRGAWDYPLKPVVYSLYRWAETVRGYLAARRKR